MTWNVRMFCVALLGMFMVVAACTPDQLALVDAIIKAAEVFTPVVVNAVGPTDSAAIVTYVDSALVVTDDLLENGANPANISKAAADFSNLALPTLTSNNPKAASLLQGLQASIDKFVMTYKTSASIRTYELTVDQPKLVNSFVDQKPTPAKPKQLTDKDKKHIEQLRDRIRQARVKLHGQKAVKPSK